MGRANFPADDCDGAVRAACNSPPAIHTLSESEERFRDIADAAPVLIWITDAGASCTWFNKAVLDFTGGPMEELLGMGFLGAVHPDDREFVARTFLEMHERREPVRVNFRARRHDGRWRVLDENAVARFAPDGSFMGFIGSCMDITEQHTAHETLREGEERSRLATETAGIGFWEFDVLNRVARPDVRVKQMFGMSPETEATKDEFFALVQEDHRKAVTEAFAETLDSVRQPVFDVEYPVIGRDGVERWVAAKGRGVFDAEGRCLRVLGTAVDITPRKRTEEALRQSEEQLRLATDFAEVGFWDADLVRDTMHWSPRVREMYGMAPDAPVSLAEFRAALHPDDHERVFAAIAATIDPARRAPYDVEYRTVGRSDGAVRWISARGRGVFDEQNRCVRMLGMIADITAPRMVEQQVRELNERLEQRVAERTAALAQSEKNIRTIFETSHLYQGLMSADGTLLYANRTSLAGIGAALEDVVGRPFWETPWFTGTPGMPERVKAAVESVADGNTENVQMRLDLPIGQRSFEFSLRPVKDDSGRVVAMVPEAVDVTERVKAEQALQQAQKMEAIGNLTGGIAHDFNNLLQGVTGNFDLIRRKAEDPARVRQWAEAGLLAADRGAKLTAQLLAFSRSQKLELRPLNLALLLSSTRELLARTLGPSVRVRMSVDENLPTVLGDETQLELAVLNCAINARDAMAQGGDLVIAARRSAIAGDGELPRGDYVELCVTDTGSGMPPDVMARAFDPFFTTKDVARGTGLGLSQVYGMARQAGGSARLRSAPGEGTTVSIFLRLAGGLAEKSAARDVAQATPQPDAARILVVDDDPDVRRFLEDSLGGMGYSVTLAENGTSGLEILDRARPDLMIIDYAMPGMNGAELSKRARDIDATLPIVFASGYAETSALERAADGRTFVLRKPFRLSELQRALSRALRR